MQRFSDFAEAQPLTGEKISMADVLNKEITVLAYRISNSHFKDGVDKYVKIQIEVAGEKRIIFTGSRVIIDQLEQYKDHLPFIATIIKIDKFFTFS